MKAYTTTSGILIPAHVLRTVRERLEAHEDAQRIQTEELRDLIPEGDDDIEIANEIINHVEVFIELESCVFCGAVIPTGTFACEDCR